MTASVVLAVDKASLILKGYPWVFPKIIKAESQVRTGEWVTVFDADNQVVAYGVYNEHSLYRVRVLALAYEGLPCELNAVITHRFQEAHALRTQLGLPNEQTDAYRLFNSEADGLSGITIDCFNDVLVVSSTAYWVELNKAIIKASLNELLPQKTILWFSHEKSLAQDGWVGEIEVKHHHETLVLESGIKFNIAFESAQKTGLFLDQRENHQRIAALTKGKSVLDLYCYTGGFALHAAAAGALNVTAVDSSLEAINRAKENVLLNGLSNIEFIEADARDYLDKAQDYDVVILDPPKLVPSKKHIEKARNYYRFLHRELFKSMKKGALLMTCNCSSAITSQEFVTLVSTQASMVNRRVKILGVYGPSMCHPVLAAFPEGQYLTAVLMEIN